MENNISQSFFCELKPTIINNNTSADLRQECSFYFNHLGDYRYKVRGFNARGVLKEGEAEIYDDEGKDSVKGEFLENGNEIDFEISSLNTFDSAVFFGHAIWTETAPDGTIRQKYNVKIWDGSLAKVESGLLAKLFSKVDKLHNDAISLRESHDALGDQYSGLNKKLTLADETISAILQRGEEIDDNLASSKTLIERAEELNKKAFANEADLEKLRENNFQLSEGNKALREQLLHTLKQAKETKQKADDALGSAITVSLAKSFKERKEESAKLKWIYDGVFLVSIIGAITLSLVIFNDLGSEVAGFSDYVEHFLVRLPFIGFPVWLCVYASKKSSAVTRIEEFYAQKQALAESYEGYKNELMNMGGEIGNSELADLMRMNLHSISKDSAHVLDRASSESHSPWENFLSQGLPFRKNPTKKPVETSNTE